MENSIPPDTPIQNLQNMTPQLVEVLLPIGIQTYHDLSAHDLFDMWLELKTFHKGVSKTTYYALWGAVHGVHWTAVPQAEKDTFSKRLGNIKA